MLDVRESEACEKGFACNNGYKTACQPGASADVEGSFRCSTCNKGEFSNYSAATTCYKCDPGFYSDKKGSSACKLCEDGKVVKCW